MMTTILPLLIGLPLVSLALLFGVRPLRRALISRSVFKTYKRILPQMSDTEREALEAGTVWWDGELFRGNPDWNKLLAYPVPRLTVEEQSFMDNETEQACALVDDWQVTTELHDLAPQAWQYIKDKGFLGMIIPKKYGGLEFSAYAHSEIVTKLSTRCSALAVSVMVPKSNSPPAAMLVGSSRQARTSTQVSFCGGTASRKLTNMRGLFSTNTPLILTNPPMWVFSMLLARSCSQPMLRAT